MKQDLLEIFKRLSFLASIALLGACSTYKPVVQLGEIPPASTPSKEAVLGTRQAVDGMLSQEGYTMVTKGPEQQRVKAVFGRLTKQVAPGESPWPVYLVDAKDNANASAINSNSIIVYTALVRRVKSDDELATILAHELGHVLAQHKNDEAEGSKRTGLQVGGYILGSVAATAVAVAGGGSGLANLAGNVADNATQIVGEGALIRSYDRAQEYEADQIGLMIMAKAAYDPSAAIKLWRRADEIFGDHGGMAFLSTHPASSDRADKLEAALPKAMEYYTAAANRASVPAAPAPKKAAKKV
jgi:metalloendopeptidase OMA1, mitochondrial